MLFFKQERNPQRLYGILIITIILTRVTLPYARYQFRKVQLSTATMISFENRKKVETKTKRSEIKRKILKDFIN